MLCTPRDGPRIANGGADTCGQSVGFIEFCIIRIDRTQHVTEEESHYYYMYI